MASEVHLRTAAGLLGADKFDDKNSPYIPTEHSRAAPFIREPVELSPVSGSVQWAATATNSRWEIHKTADYLGNTCIRVPLSSLGQTGGTFARYSDWVGLCMWSQIRIKYGTQLLQTIIPEEIWIAINYFEPDEKAQAYRYMLRGDRTTVQRIADATQNIEVKIPLITAFFHKEESLHLFINGMSTKLAIEIDWLPPSFFTQTDSPNALGNATTPGTPLTAQQYLVGNVTLNCEYIHILEGERKAMKDLYRDPEGLRQVFNDQQYFPNEILAGTTTLTAAYPWTSYIKNITKLAHCIFVLWRWAADLNRTVGGAGGQGGRDLFNVEGPMTVGAQRLITTYEIKTGNNWVVKPGSIDEFMFWFRQKMFKGYPTKPIVAYSFSHDSTIQNATLGGIEFNLLDQPTATITLSNNTYATVNAAATASIGQNSDLRMDFIAFNHNNIDISAHDLHKPYD